MKKSHSALIALIFVIIGSAILSLLWNSQSKLSSSTAQISYNEGARIMNAYDSSSGSESLSPDTQTQYVIKNGNLQIQVQDVENMFHDISAIAQSFGGTITNRYITQYNDTKNATVELKVEHTHFDTAMDEIKQLAMSVTSESATANDITRDVMDLDARLKAARAEERAYISVLEKATSVEDILMVQSALSIVRGTIERYETQRDYYSNVTDYSFITVLATERTGIAFDSDSFQPWQTVKDSVQTVIRVFQDLFLGVITLLIVGGAFLIPTIAIVAFVFWLKKRNR